MKRHEKASLYQKLCLPIVKITLRPQRRHFECHPHTPNSWGFARYQNE